MKIYELIIIGGGPAALTAGIYGGRAKLNPLIFSGSPGKGELASAINIDDFPGFPQGISGLDLLDLMLKQAQQYNCQIIPKEIIAVDFKQQPFKLVTENQEEYFARAVIIATGGSIRWLGLEKEKELVGHGISVCAICDGAFFKNKIVAVVGGGDVALEEALYLTKYAFKVYLIHRRNEFRAAPLLQEEIKQNSQIEILYDSEVIKLIGDNKLEKIVIKNNKTQEAKELEIDGLFLAIGFDPVTEIFKNDLERDEKGYLKVHDIVKTSLDGIFAAGDVCDSKYRQAITAAGSGAIAAIEADKWLRQKRPI